MRKTQFHLFVSEHAILFALPSHHPAGWTCEFLCIDADHLASYSFWTLNWALLKFLSHYKWWPPHTEERLLWERRDIFQPCIIRKKEGLNIQYLSVQFSLVAQLCPTLCDPMDCSTPGLHVHHQLQEFTQTQVHGVGDAIQQSHPLSSTSPPAFNLAQHQGLFQWVTSSHPISHFFTAKVLEFLLQHQSFQWVFRTDFL